MDDTTALIEVLPSDLHGEGIFAKLSIGAHATICHMFTVIRPAQTLPVWPYDLDLSVWCWKFNHLTKSNCQLLTDGRIWQLATKHEIKSGEELTLDYKTLPAFMSRDTEGFVERHRRTD